jgi:methylphosphotriester-DNA--protein-cysteine methyltransferase
VNCPVCKAVNEVGVVACRRCRADLALVVAVEARRVGLIAAAKNAISGGKYDEALRSLASAQAVRSGGDVEKLKAVVHLMQRDFSQALTCYRGCHA